MPHEVARLSAADIFLLKPKKKRFTIKIITIFAIEECIAYINNIYGVVWF